MLWLCARALLFAGTHFNTEAKRFFFFSCCNCMYVLLFCYGQLFFFFSARTILPKPHAAGGGSGRGLGLGQERAGGE